MTKNILVLGGSGYLGSSIAKRFLSESNFKVTIGDLIKPKDSNCNFVYCDVIDQQLVNSRINYYDIIVNCTGQITSPMNLCFNLNTQGIENILSAIQSNHKKILHISTVAVYGTCDYADESTPINPETSYAACKAFAEYKIENSLSKESYCILRLSNLYGGLQEKGLFAYLLESYKSGEALYFNQNGNLLRYFLHVDDCANAIYLAIQKNLCGIYNIAAYEKYNIKEIISLIEQLRDIKFFVNYTQTEPYENIYNLSIEKFVKDSGFIPQVTIHDFIEKTFKEYARR